MASKYVCNAAGCWQKWVLNRQTIMQSEGFRSAKNRKEQLKNVNRYFKGDPPEKDPKGKERMTMWDVGDVASPSQFDSVDQYLGHPEANFAMSQFERDAGFWYGALQHPGTSDQIVLKKVFSILYYGGLMVRQGNNWRGWQSLEPSIPIAAAISHTSRVLVQLPSFQKGVGSRIWQWLNQGGAIQPRSKATHDIEIAQQGEIVNGTKYARELKPKAWQVRDGIHYYMNVALGGNGYTNPFSGNTIDAEGKHGHLYFCYVPPVGEQVGGLLITTEQSASADVYLGPEAKKVKVVAKALQGVDDQYGGTHNIGILGHNTYSATGGNDWTKGNLANRGPDKYYDGMYVDLAQRFQFEHVLENWENFRSDLLGWTGEEPPVPPRPLNAAPPMPGRPARPQHEAPLNSPPGRRPFRPQQAAPLLRPPGRPPLGN